jgi:hypothetical protein
MLKWIPAILIGIVASIQSCKSDTIAQQEAQGNLSDDFFLVGEYYCYKIYDIDSLKYLYYDLDDGLTVSISPVENGFSRITWKIQDSVIKTVIFSDYGIPISEDPYNYPYPQQATVKCRDINQNNLATFKCYPSYINYGYLTDSIHNIGYIFRNGSASLMRIP